jgi:site-specific DNA recombinase
MPRQRNHPERVLNFVGFPGPGTSFVGYVRYSGREQSPQTNETQKHWIERTVLKYSWQFIGWYEEPKESAKYEDLERRPQFAALLEAAGVQFAGILCYHLDRWSRNPVVTYSSLARLRKLRVWWQSIVDEWDIDLVQRPGPSKLFSLAVQEAADYLTVVSDRTIRAKEARAVTGLHNGNVMFGYLPPVDPRLPATPDPKNFAALIKLGELTAQGTTDQQVADLLANSFTKSSRFGERPLTKDTVAAIRRSVFPREYAPGCGYGTIMTPSGQLIQGKHSAAWTYDLCLRMDEAVRQRRRQSRTPRPPSVHPFSRIIACSGCRRQLRSAPAGGVLYYKDTSRVRKLPCPAFGCLSVRAEVLTQQFGALLQQVRLPQDWQQRLIMRCHDVVESMNSGDAHQRRQALEGEQSRLIHAYRKGYIDDQQLEEEIATIRAELAAIPMALIHDFEQFLQRATEVAGLLGDLATYWGDAVSPRAQREMIAALVTPGGVIYDLQRQLIVGLRPQPEALPALELGLGAEWHHRDDGHGSDRSGGEDDIIWLKPEFYDRDAGRSASEAAAYEPAQRSRLTQEQRQMALELLRTGQSLQQIADKVGCSYWALLRLARRFVDPESARPPQQRPKLSAEQQAEVLDLLASGMSLRAVARRFGVSYASIDRIKHKQRNDSHASGSEAALALPNGNGGSTDSEADPQRSQ